MTATVCCHYSTLLCVSLSLSLKPSKSEPACSLTSFSQSTGRCVCFPAARWCSPGVWNLYLCIGPFGVLHYLCPPPLPVGEHKHTGGGMMDGCEDSWLCWGETLHSAVDNFHTVPSRWLTGTALPVCVIWRLLPYSASCHSQLCLCPMVLIITILWDVAGHLILFLTRILRADARVRMSSRNETAVPHAEMFWDSSRMVSNRHTVFCSKCSWWFIGNMEKGSQRCDWHDRLISNLPH